MSITTDTSNSTDSEVEWTEFIPCASVFSVRKTCFLEERHNEGSKATVNMQTNIMLCSKFAQNNYIVLISIREIDG